MLIIPGAMAALIGAHLYLVTKLGISAPPWLKPSDHDPDHAVAEDEVQV